MTHPIFLVAAIVLLVGWLPLIVVSVRNTAIDGLVALQVAGAVATLVLICLAVGLHQSAFGSVALISAVCTIVGGLVFARVLGRRP